MEKLVPSRARQLVAGPLIAALVVVTAGGAVVAHLMSPNSSDTSYSFLDPKLAITPSAEPTPTPSDDPMGDSHPSVATPVPTPKATPTPRDDRDGHRASRSDDDRASESGSEDEDDSANHDHCGDDDEDEPTSD